MPAPNGLLVDLTVRNYAERLAAGSATPGGGSAAALAGALAASLACMAASLTVGRPKYAACEAEMQAVLSQAERLRRQLLALVDADAAAFENVMAAYRLPKLDDDSKSVRANAIEEAFKHAVDIPLAIAEACMQTLNAAVLAAEHGNPHASSDATVGALLAHAGLLGAARDVRVNLNQIRDTQFCKAAEARVSGLVNNAEATLARALDK